MITVQVIKTMKQNNVSVNSDLTKQRTKEVLRAASRVAKHDIDALAGLKRVSINRVCATGNISAKIALAIAQTLNLNPFFLTGEADEKGEYTAETLNVFLTAKGYANLVPKAPRRSRKAPAAVAEDAVPAEAEAAPECPETDCAACSDSTETLAAGMTEEEAVYMLRSLFIRAKYSSSVQSVLDEIKALLTK